MFMRAAGMFLVCFSPNLLTLSVCCSYDCSMSQTQEKPRRSISSVNDKRIGLILWHERNKMRLTLDEVGTALELNHSTISQYEHGTRTIPAGRVEPYAKLFGLDPRLIDPDAA